MDAILRVGTPRSPLQQALAKARQHMLFSAFSEEHFQELGEQARLHRLGNEEILFRQGDKANRFFYVVSGHIKLNRLSADGQEKVIEVFGPQQTFAEAIMFMEQQAYPVNAQALGETVLLSVHNGFYKSLLTEHADYATRLLADMAKRLHMRINEIENLTMQNATHRVVRYLLNQLPSLQVVQAQIELPMAKRLIASKLAMQPETFSRIMHELKERQILSVQGRQLQILDVQALKDFGE